MAQPVALAAVTIGDEGRSLEWPGGIDFSAAALWQAAQPKRASWTASG